MIYKKIDLTVIILESFQKGCSLKPCQNICFLNICRYKKKSNALAWAVQKTNFWGVHLGAPGGGGCTSILCQTICCLNIYQYKNYHPTLIN